MNPVRRLITAAFAYTLIFSAPTNTMAQTDINKELVPTGKLRVGINGSNATL